MEEQINIVVKKPKTDATWILGIIAFVTSIPNVCCALFCAGAVSAMSELSTLDHPEKKVVADAAATFSQHMTISILLVSIFCFILSFFGKKNKVCIATGTLMILGSLWILINSFTYGSILWGPATGIMFLISGILSILNNKRA